MQIKKNFGSIFNKETPPRYDARNPYRSPQVPYFHACKYIGVGKWKKECGKVDGGCKEEVFNRK